MSTRLRLVPEQRPAAQPASQHPRRARPAANLNAAGLVPWPVVLFAPVLGIVLLRAPLINVRHDNDPWLYSGYGWTLAHHIEIFGWPYYADRFRVILPIAVSAGLLGPVPAISSCTTC